jgi:hypothetical protein
LKQVIAGADHIGDSLLACFSIALELLASRGSETNGKSSLREVVPA